ncbi:uncharacterized protein [Euphorbia lathyris]|uniref:uncharacterized protein n=1 Tax=Euphorbia lathyris TaxID=212925 RepID=UPI00331318CF
MVFLRHQVPSRKRPSSSSFVSPLVSSKVPKPTATEPPPSCSENEAGSPAVAIDKLVSILADAGCTLINPSGPPCLPSDSLKLRSYLDRLFSTSNDGPVLRSHFLAGLSAYINSSQNLRRLLFSSNQYGRTESLMRHLLLVPSIQLDIQILLLEKIPEYFDVSPESSFEDDAARLIINQFRWLDFIVDSNAFCEKLMQVLSISPLPLKKEIIGSLPEIIGDPNTKAVVDYLGQMLQEDSSIIIPVLDCFSNLQLEDVLQEQVTTIAISFIPTIDGESIPHLLRFLLLSATPQNVRRIIRQIREQLNFVGISNYQATQHRGKALVDSTEASILDALRTTLLFKNVLCEEVVKELISLEKPQDHKIIDLWLIVLIYMNGESMQKTIEKILKKKVVGNCIQKVMIDQCIFGNKELVKGYFPSFLSLSEYLLASREQKAREFGIHMYLCLFEAFTDTYYRQEVVGSIITHVGSGISFEVNSALQALSFLVSKCAQDLIPFATHINGLLDYLEGFTIENLHKVYEILSQMALLAQSGAERCRSSFGNEILMIVRKQVSHPDLKYKKMGLIGVLKIVSCLADANEVSDASFQKTDSEEALELLRTSLESCKHLYLPLVLLYDELAALLEYKKLQPTIMEWIVKHVGEFESLFLSDLDGGQLCVPNTYEGLEGQLWMNLDGDMSPICLSIFRLASSLSESMTSLQTLPAYFLLLSAVERLTNQGSLGGIDALLGCPLQLPSFKYFSKDGWQSLTAKQKQIVVLSLYYAVNWIRELLNAFCTQVVQGFECISQAAREDVITKLLKRLRNLIVLESLLNNFIQCHPMSLPELHFHFQHCETSFLDHANNTMHVENKNEQKNTQHTTTQNKPKVKKISKPLTSSNMNGRLRQPTLFDVLSKKGAATGKQVLSEDSSGQSLEPLKSADQDSCNSTEPLVLEISAATKALDTQRFKFRPLLSQCFSLLEFSVNQKQDSCCSDPAAELPLHLYLLRDLHEKLDCFTTTGKKNPSRCTVPAHGYSKLTIEEFLSKIRPLFPNLRRHFDCAVSILKDGDKTCEGHWEVHSESAGNPDITNHVLTKSSVPIFVCKEVLHCFSKMLNLPEIQVEKGILLDLLQEFQLRKSETVCSAAKQSPLVGTIEDLYVGAFSFMEDVLHTACTFSFMLASESLLTLESIFSSVQKFLDNLERTGKNTHSTSIHQAVPTFRNRLGNSAQKLLKHNWDDENLDNGWKNKGEIVQKVLHIYLENSESKSELLDEIAGSIMSQTSPTLTNHDCHGFQTLRNETFVVWYRELHEENLASLKSSVKDAIHGKLKDGVQLETVEKHLIRIKKSVNVLVSLINLCRTHNKVSVHAVAVKYGGKFVDSFLKGFDFLQAHFLTHKELVLELVTELQKATRTIQTLCSEAKGSKQIVITSKIPSTKRSIERFLFHVKALLHTKASASTFWMGNLKHKDLNGQIVSSQLYSDDQNANVDEDEDSAEGNDNDQPFSVASEDEDS